MTTTEAKAKIKHVYRDLLNQGFGFIQLDELHTTITKEINDDKIFLKDEKTNYNYR